MGEAEVGIADLEKRLCHNAFAAPERPDLLQLKLGRAQLAAAERVGRILRLSDDVVLLPSAPGLALELLRQLPQPFTTSAARAAMGTTRQVRDSIARASGPVGLDHLHPARVQDHRPWRCPVTLIRCRGLLAGSNDHLDRFRVSGLLERCFGLVQAVPGGDHPVEFDLPGGGQRDGGG